MATEPNVVYRTPLVPLPEELGGNQPVPYVTSPKKQLSLLEKLQQPTDVGNFLPNPRGWTGRAGDAIEEFMSAAKAMVNPNDPMGQIGKSMLGDLNASDLQKVYNQSIAPGLESATRMFRDPETGVTEDDPTWGVINALMNGIGLPDGSMSSPKEMAGRLAQPFITTGAEIMNRAKPQAGPPQAQPQSSQPPAAQPQQAPIPQQADFQQQYSKMLAQKQAEAQGFQDQVNQTRQGPSVLQQIGRILQGASTGYRGGDVAALQRQYQALDEGLTPQQQIAGQQLLQSNSQTDPSQAIQVLSQLGLLPDRQRLLGANADLAEAQAEQLKAFSNPQFLQALLGQ